MSLPGNCWITWVTDMKTVYVFHPNQNVSHWDRQKTTTFTLCILKAWEQQ